MKVWVDAQLSPLIARWLGEALSVDAVALRDIGFRDAEDTEIYAAARVAGAVIITKDEDFADLVRRLGPPPSIIWIRSGNTSNARLRVILKTQWPEISVLLGAGEGLVEVTEQA